MIFNLSALIQYNSWYPYHLSSYLIQPFKLLLISHRLYQIAHLFILMQASDLLDAIPSFLLFCPFFCSFLYQPSHMKDIDNSPSPPCSSQFPYSQSKPCYTIHCPAPFACVASPTNFTSHCKTSENFSVISANILYLLFCCCCVSYCTFFVQLSYKNKFVSN